MLTTDLLAKKLASDFPHLRFIETTSSSRWSPASSTIFYNRCDNHSEWVLLHEAAHGILQHSDYLRDIQLIRIESEAWHYASESLGPKYSIAIDLDFIEDHLDTYRDWLHARSTCPVCTTNGIEIRSKRYYCAFCRANWSVAGDVTEPINRQLLVTT